MAKKPDNLIRLDDFEVLKEVGKKCRDKHKTAADIHEEEKYKRILLHICEYLKHNLDDLEKGESNANS